MSDRRVVRTGLSVTITTAYAITSKHDGGAAENFKVPQKGKRLKGIEFAISAEALAAVQENNVILRLQGDGLPGGPYYFVCGGVSTGTTSTAGFANPLQRIDTDLPVVSGGAIDADGFNVGDTLIVLYTTVALVFEE